MRQILLVVTLFFMTFFKAQGTINVGFNAKGNLSTKEQTELLEKELNILKTKGIDTGKIWLRLNGGTISQKTYSKNWLDEDIEKWSKIQNNYKCKFIFVINFNDSPKNQKEFFNRFISQNINFSFIELGNEQYLKKFSKNDNDNNEEVTLRTENMNGEKYIKMSKEYIDEFSDEKLPIYIQMAPNFDERKEYLEWNKAIANAINNDLLLYNDIGITLHLYEREGPNSLDVSQITRVKELIKKPIKIAITEYGVINNNQKVVVSGVIKQEINLSKRILEAVSDGDTVLNQVLYTDYKDVGTANIHRNYNGLTPKGNEILQLFSTYLK